jgi:hypothetical protein
MGYESKLFIIRKTNLPVETPRGELKFAEIMAIYEMGKFPPFQKIFDKSDCPVAEYCPIIRDDEIFEDLYGDPLRERSLDEVIDCLDQFVALNDDLLGCARARPLLAMLQEYRKIQNNWYQLAVLHYGH